MFKFLKIQPKNILTYAYFRIVEVKETVRITNGMFNSIYLESFGNLQNLKI